MDNRPLQDVELLQNLQHMPEEVLLRIIERLPLLRQLRLRTSGIPRIRQAALVALEHAQIVETMVIQGRDELLFFDTAAHPALNLIPRNNITRILLSSIQANNRQRLNVRGAIGRVLMLPELQHIGFSHINNMTNLVPLVVNPSLISITLDPTQANNDNRAHLLRLCLDNSQSLQELHILGLTDNVFNEVIERGFLAHFLFPRRFPNVQHLTLRFRLSMQPPRMDPRIVPPVILSSIMNDLPQLTYLDIENQGPLNNPDERNSFNTELGGTPSNLQTLRITARDYNPAFSNFIQQRFPNLRTVIMHGTSSIQPFRDSIQQMDNIDLQDRNPQVNFLHIQGNASVDLFLEIVGLRFPRVNHINVLNSHPRLRANNIISFGDLQLVRLEYDLKFLELVVGTTLQFNILGRDIFWVYNGRVFVEEAAQNIALVFVANQILEVRLYTQAGYDQVFPLN